MVRCVAGHLEWRGDGLSPLAIGLRHRSSLRLGRSPRSDDLPAIQTAIGRLLAGEVTRVDLRYRMHTAGAGAGIRRPICFVIKPLEGATLSHAVLALARPRLIDS